MSSLAWTRRERLEAHVAVVHALTDGDVPMNAKAILMAAFLVAGMFPLLAQTTTAGSCSESSSLTSDTCTFSCHFEGQIQVQVVKTGPVAPSISASCGGRSVAIQNCSSSCGDNTGVLGALEDSSGWCLIVGDGQGTCTGVAGSGGWSPGDSCSGEMSDVSTATLTGGFTQACTFQCVAGQFVNAAIGFAPGLPGPVEVSAVCGGVTQNCSTHDQCNTWGGPASFSGTGVCYARGHSYTITCGSL